MTTSELAGALAAQRAIYRPEHVPPFADLVARKRIGDRRKRAAASTALAVGIAGAVIVLPGALDERPETVRSQVGQQTQAPLPDERRLRSAFASLTPPVMFGSVEIIQEGPAALGDQPRQQTHALTAVTPDRQVSLSWGVLAPALTDAEARASAATGIGGRGREQGTQLATGVAQNGPVRSLAYRFDNGSLVRVLAWSADGGVATVTSGAGATTTDIRVAAMERAVRSLLSDR